jgi:branched-chain amino acid transport system substrate-binding protein
MKKALLLGAAISAAVATSAGAQELRIGFINTFTGGAAILGKEQLNGFKLGLEHEGWTKNGDKLGGVPMKLFIGDDQRKPDVGLRVARKMLTSDRVQIVSGLFWSNILMPIQRIVTRAGRIVLTTNAGAAPMAGRQCNKLFLATSFNNDQFAESMGQLMTKEGIKSVYMLAPNYQAGKDMFAGFKRFYKNGRIVGETLFKLGQTDFQADISKLRAARPAGVFVFAPGGMGIAFFKQWSASGANRDIKLYSVAVVDYLTLKPIGAAAVGTYHTAPWKPEAKTKTNQRFIKDYIAKYGRHPSWYAAEAYDAPRLLAAALRKVGGKLDNLLALSKALRHTAYPSTKESIRFNVNGVPIENWYKREVVLGPNGKPMIKTLGIVMHDQKDSYWRQCPKGQRL